MAKFIIEVDDNFIRECGKIENVTKNLDSQDSNSVLKTLFNTIAFGVISKKLDQGVSEFCISRDMMNDATKRNFFDRNVGEICMLVQVAEKKEEGQDENQEVN